MLASVIVVFLAVVSFTEERRASPSFKGNNLPAPPDQTRPWTPPKTTLAKVFVTATTALFEAGLADPRGCEYRTIEIGVGSCWSGDGGIVETHGWVLPTKKGVAQRFAVCWNGLVYPVVTIKERADLKIDIRAILKADEQVRAQVKDGRFYRHRHAWQEGYSASYKSLLPIKACLLLRLGEEELARGVWEAWTAGMRADTNDDATHLADPYLMLATDWLWAMFDRAVCAHMRGDDRLALVDARLLTRVHKEVDAESAKRGFPRREGMRGEKLPYFSFLEQLPLLLRDQERRAKSKPEAPRPREKENTKRIAALIRDLENVSARQWGQPGGVSLSMDGIVKALIEEGEAAVEPLTRCLEEDDRLTRSVHFWRDFARHRTILGVHEAAYAALQDILKTSFFGIAATGDNLTARGSEGRRKVAESIRAYWKKFGTLPIEERWFIVLTDDKLSSGPWLQAAANIVQPIDVTVRGVWVTTPERKPGEKPRLRGEVLRSKKGPSVTELIIRRIDQLSRSEKSGYAQLLDHFDACRLVDYLVAWDGKAALPVLQTQMKRCRDYLKGTERPNTTAFGYLGPAIARFTQKRLQAGDASALDEYAEWIKTIGPKDASHSYRDVLYPMWQYPDHAGIAAAAEAMFNTKGSPWTERFLRAFNTHELGTTPMIGVAGFRKRYVVELADKRPAGKLNISDEGYGSIEVTDGYSGGPTVHTIGDPLAPKPGTERGFRVCDYYAWMLSRLQGAPRCELYWPIAERDKAVAAGRAFLEKYGERFKYTNEIVNLSYSDLATVRMQFSPRERPATVEEAKRGQAIFALGDTEKVRVVKLAGLPMKARWTAYKGGRSIESVWDTKQKRTIYQVKHDQQGLIWQAEEVFQAGKWQRYYGFVGRHVVAMVPANEIEFPPPEKKK